MRAPPDIFTLSLYPDFALLSISHINERICQHDGIRIFESVNGQAGLR